MGGPAGRRLRHVGFLPIRSGIVEQAFEIVPKTRGRAPLAPRSGRAALRRQSPQPRPHHCSARDRDGVRRAVPLDCLGDPAASAPAGYAAEYYLARFPLMFGRTGPNEQATEIVAGADTRDVVNPELAVQIAEPQTAGRRPNARGRRRRRQRHPVVVCEADDYASLADIEREREFNDRPQGALPGAFPQHIMTRAALVKSCIRACTAPAAGTSRRARRTASGKPVSVSLAPPEHDLPCAPARNAAGCAATTTWRAARGHARSPCALDI